MTAEHLSEEEKQQILRETYELDRPPTDDEQNIFGANLEVKRFISTREYGKSRRNPRSVILVGHKDKKERIEYKPQRVNGEFDKLANELRDYLPDHVDPYVELINWIEEQARKE